MGRSGSNRQCATTLALVGPVEVQGLVIHAANYGVVAGLQVLSVLILDALLEPSVLILDALLASAGCSHS
jgi:hypothetical protein